MTEQVSLPRAGERVRRFEAIFQATHSRVLAYVLRRSADRSLAEEVVSETFLVAWRRIEVVPEEPLPWLLGTARKVLANRRRSDRRREAVGPRVDLDMAELSDPATPMEERIADRHEFARAFTLLGARDREVLTLVAWDGLGPREAAQVMGCTAATFSLRLHRARRRLVKELKAGGHSPYESEGP
ncbi:MAG TPA: sigma-70 family RNA polymerase sigma factor [Solirubrobacterales bacterium]|nr:sigma-70 family RNA polymerase sigma factor [Solirubrobacterales bacterium]